jgi:hypothetical protein
VNLLEATVATAIVATVSAATLGAVANAAHAAGGDPVHDALASAATREARVALDVLKYGGATIAPATVATAIPLATGTPLPADVSIGIAAFTNGSATITVTATASGSSNESASVTESLDSRAPLPGAQSIAPGLAPAPTGAP